MKNAQKLAAAVAEAERFIERVKAIQAYRSHSHGTDAYYDAGPKETGAGRLLWIVMHAAIAGGMATDAPDIRILQGMGNALGDLRERGDPLDVHRAAIQSGLLAVDRLIPDCTEMRLALAAAELDTMIQSARGLGTADLQKLLEPQT